MCYDPGGSRPRPMRFACLFSICRYNRQLDPGVWVIGWATKALLRWKSGERWVGRRIWIEIGFGLSLVLECRWFWSVVGCGLSLVVDYRRRLFILPFT